MVQGGDSRERNEYGHYHLSRHHHSERTSSALDDDGWNCRLIVWRAINVSKQLKYTVSSHGSGPVDVAQPCPTGGPRRGPSEMERESGVGPLANPVPSLESQAELRLVDVRGVPSAAAKT